MQLYRNERLIKRNNFLGRLMTFGGLGASFAAVIIVFLQPSLLSLAFGLMVREDRAQAVPPGLLPVLLPSIILPETRERQNDE